MHKQRAAYLLAQINNDFQDLSIEEMEIAAAMIARCAAKRRKSKPRLTVVSSGSSGGVDANLRRSAGGF